MLRHKNIDRICCIVLAATLLLTCTFMGAAASGLIEGDSSMGYENRLFDQDYVHTIDIVMNDWEGFLETCTSEEYASCTVVIDGENYGNVAIRAKGNTSLSSVASYGNDRYSFKIEFDHYETGKTYYGLDKLSLNNLIQDKTYMKDYLAYTLMGKMGVASPLCSFVQVNVNGEVWGLYLAVEAVEDSFLTRNYGSDHGELYKPDSLSFGGGRGNGRDFDMTEFSEKFAEMQESGESETDESSGQSSGRNMGGMGRMDMSRTSGDESGEPSSDVANPGAQSESGQATPPAGDGTASAGSFDPAQMMSGLTDGIFNKDFDWTALFGEDFDFRSIMSGDFNLADYVDADFDVSQIFSEDFDPAQYFGEDFEYSDMLEEGFDWTPLFTAIGENARESIGSFGGMSMGSSDVMLQYVDDDPDSYSNIFSSAKTDVSEEDQERLIEALRRLSEGEDMEEVLSAVDAEAVIRYLVVHNFLCNDDSYTGTMIHNYYLYEEDGALSMIPWDYNLAFGGFSMGGMGFGGSTGATSTVNSPIDSPVSSGDISSRPILAWIFESEEYTALYHEIYAEFMETYFTSGWVTEEIERVSAMIAPYVEADPTAFFTYEQFQTAAETLKEFCSLRAESILGQLDGSIPSTTSGQNADSSALVDASHVDLSDLGEFNQGGMGGRGGSTTGMPDISVGMPEMPDGFTFPGGGTAENDAEPTVPGAGEAGTTTPETGAAGSMTPPEGFDGELPEGFDPSAMGGMPSGGMGMPGQSGDTAVGDAASAVMPNGQMGSMTPPEGFDPSAMGGMPGGGMGMPGMGGDAAAAQSGMQPVEQQTQSGMTPETGMQPESEGTAKEGAEPEASAQPEISATEGNQTPAEEAEGAQGESAKPSREQGGFSGEFPGMENMNGGASDSSQWIMLAVCAAALIAGIIAAKVCKSGR